VSLGAGRENAGEAREIEDAVAMGGTGAAQAVLEAFGE